jgi:hypothetical protein
MSRSLRELAGADALWCAFYLGGSQCALPGRLIEHFPEDIVSGQFDLDWITERLLAFSKSAVSANGVSDREIAVGTLARAEAARMASTLSDPVVRSNIGDHIDIESSIDKAREDTVNFLASYGMMIDDPVVRIVDKFPKPYEERGYAILTADSGDYRKYDVRPGLYIAESKIRPFYTEALVCHELIHVALGSISPEDMARGLEEGIAELVGSVLLSCRRVGVTATLWIETFGRHTSVYDLFWEHYNDFLRMAYLYYRRVGIDGLMQVVKAGRSRIKQIEADLVQGNIPEDTGTRSGSPDGSAVDAVLDRIVFAVSRSMIVSAESRMVAEHAEIGATVKEISARTKLSEDTVKNSLRELSESAVVIGRRPDGLVVSSSDLGIYLGAGALRFSL